MKRATVSSENMNRLIAAVKDFVAPSCSTREIYKYILLRFDAEHNEVTAAACDGFRLSVEKAHAFEIEEDFTVTIRPCHRFPVKTLVSVSLENEEAIIRCAGNITGCAQIKGEYLDYEKFFPPREHSLRIAFSPKYLADAIKAAKASLDTSQAGLPIILEFTRPNEPAYIVTTKESGFRMVLPIRMRGKNREFGCKDGGQIDE